MNAPTAAGLALAFVLIAGAWVSLFVLVVA